MIFIRFLGDRLLGALRYFWNDMGSTANKDINSLFMWRFFNKTIFYIIVTTAPFMIIAFVIAFVSQKFQIKWMVTSKPLQPKLNKINPISGFKRIFSMQSLFELLFSLVKIAVFTFVCYSYLKDNVTVLVSVYSLRVTDVLSILFNLVIGLGIRISIVYIIISLADLMYRRWKHKKDLRMTKQEVKDEYKNQEGDPKIKSQQRQRMQQASRRRMMESIPQADVVITNPTHFAVALKYDSELGQAPIVTAKGADYLAMKIKDIARENDVELYEDKALARMLYNNVKIGDQIPPELYVAVAEVLAYVYNLKNKV